MTPAGVWWHENVASDDGLRLHVRATAGADTPLVLCHGLGLSSVAWELMAESLSGRCIAALDFRGHGDSDWDSTGDYDRNAMAEDVRATLDALRIERGILIGHSFGGDIVARLALDYPSRVHALVLVDVGPEIRPGGMRSLRELTARMPNVHSTCAEYREWLETIFPLADPRALTVLVSNGLRRRADGQFQLKADPAFADAMFAFEALASPRARWALLERIEQPTLVVRGADSAVLCPEIAERMAQVLKKGAYTVVPNAGHSVMLDNPVGLAAAIDAFVCQLFDPPGICGRTSGSSG